MYTYTHFIWAINVFFYTINLVNVVKMQVRRNTIPIFIFTQTHDKRHTGTRTEHKGHTATRLRRLICTVLKRF